MIYFRIYDSYKTAIPSSDEWLSALIRAAEELHSEQQGGSVGGGHTRSVGVCLGLPEAGTLVGSAVIYERVGEILRAWLVTGGAHPPLFTHVHTCPHTYIHTLDIPWLEFITGNSSLRDMLQKLCSQLLTLPAQCVH